MTALTSCDRFVSVDFSVSNSTPYQLQIIHCPFQGTCEVEQDTSIISPSTTLLFSNHSFIGGSTTHDFLSALEVIPEIRVSTTNGKEMKKDVSDIENWLKIFPEDEQGVGEVMFQVRKEFFD